MQAAHEALCNAAVVGGRVEFSASITLSLGRVDKDDVEIGGVAKLAASEFSHGHYRHGDFLSIRVASRAVAFAQVIGHKSIAALHNQVGHVAQLLADFFGGEGARDICEPDP